ncbi:MAG: 50S ribosomal protein L25 [Planctomycetaceae bacterium]|nr:50S ribosomal protein L25 [Planctomycetaceae bacterium]
MSDDPKLVAQRRDSVGTTSTKKLRAAGQVPGSVYGHKQDSVSFAAPVEQLMPIINSGHRVVDLELEGNQEKVLIQDVQWDTYSKNVLHVDLLRVDPNERVSTSVDIIVRGVAPGVLLGGILEQPHHTLPIECPVIRLPENIVVRVSDLALGGAIHVRDLVLPKDCVSTLPGEEIIVHVVTPRGMSTEEETAQPGEPELVGGKKEDAE